MQLFAAGTWASDARVQVFLVATSSKQAGPLIRGGGRAAPGCSGRPIYAWYYWLQQQTCQRGIRTPAHAEHLARGARAPASAAIRVERRLQAQAAERLPQGRCLFKPDGPMPPSQTWAVHPPVAPSPRPPTSAYAAAAAAAWPHALPAHGRDGGAPPQGLGVPLPAC